MCDQHVSPFWNLRIMEIKWANSSTCVSFWNLSIMEITLPRSFYFLNPILTTSSISNLMQHLRVLTSRREINLKGCGPGIMYLVGMCSNVWFLHSREAFDLWSLLLIVLLTRDFRLIFDRSESFYFMWSIFLCFLCSMAWNLALPL